LLAGKGLRDRLGRAPRPGKASDQDSRVRGRLAKTDLIILDDWGLAKLSAEQRRDLLELLDDRHGTRSTIVTSSQSITRTRSLAIRPWPMPFWTASCPTPTGHLT